MSVVGGATCTSTGFAVPLTLVEYRTEPRPVCVALDPKILHVATRIERIPEEIVKQSANSRETVGVTASECSV